MKTRLGSIFQRKKKLKDGTVRLLPTYWCQFYVPGRKKPYRESTGCKDPEAATRYLKRRLGEEVVGTYRGTGPENITVADLAQAVIEDYADNDRKSIAHAKRRLKLHIIPILGNVRAAEFGTEHLRRFIRTRREAGAANATINRELAIINRAFKLAYEADPPRVLRKPKVAKLRENNVREGFLEYDEYLRLRNALPEELRMLLVIAYYTGVRRGELITIQWKQVDLRAARIRLAVGTTKNDEGRYLPIYGEMAEWLAMAKSIHDQKYPDCPWVFHRKGKRIRDFRKAWKLARSEAKVPQIMLHDMRRTAVRNMTRAGIPREIAMKISGHKTDAIFRRYNIVSDRDLDLAAERMNAYMSDQVPVNNQPELGKRKAN